jgi:protein-S-isoprenylcysteine O-methyltransferase Ste14
MFLKFHHYFKSKYRIAVSRLFFITTFAIFIFGRNGLEMHTVVLAEILFLFGVLLVGVGVLGRAWSLSYIAGMKNKSLVTKGPYSLCRHPLYLFSFAGCIGIGLCTETLTVPLIILIGFAIYYPLAIKKEEFKMASRFRDDYEIYAATVPCFVPNFRTFQDDEIRTINSNAFLRGLTSLIYFIALIGVFELIESLHTAGLLVPFYTIY